MSEARFINECKRSAIGAIVQMERAIRGDKRWRPEELRQIRNFLVFQYESALGSIVHATPFLEAVKTAIPGAHITVAAGGMAAEILARNPYIDRCSATPDPRGSYLKAHRAVRALLASMPPGPACAITMLGNQRTRIGLLGVTAGRTARAGYTVAPGLYDVPLDFTLERGQIEGNLDILRTLGHEVSTCEPRIFFNREESAAAAGLLQQAIRDTDGPRVAFVTQCSGGHPKQWRAERFKQVISNLHQAANAIAIFVGTSADAAAIEILRADVRTRNCSFAGKTSLPQLAALLAQCDLAISLDTGTFHVARAVGLPGVVIAPAWQTALEWLPVGNPHYRVLQGPLIPEPYPGYVIDEVSADQVFAAALDLLEKYPADPTERASRVEHSIR